MIYTTTMVLRRLTAAWAAAALLPIPALVMIDPAVNADIACLYLGLASAWLATEIHSFGGFPESRSAWLAKAAATGVALAVNAALFISFGLVVAVQSNLPFPLIAVLSVVPAFGIVPWLTVRVRERFVAIVLGVGILFAAKLAGCVVARIVYGPDFVEEGYVAADWRTAKLMISLFWGLATALSVGLLLAGFWQHKPYADPTPGD